MKIEEFGLLKILMRTHITKTSMELFQSPQITFYVRPIQDDMQGFAPIGWICKRERYVGIYDSFLGLWNSFIEVLVVMVRIWIFKSPNSSCLNYYYKNYGYFIHKQFFV